MFEQLQKEILEEYPIGNGLVARINDKIDVARHRGYITKEQEKALYATLSDVIDRTHEWRSRRSRRRSK